MKLTMLDPTELPEWLRPGCSVIHDTFGEGVVRSYRVHKSRPALEVDFGGTIKLLSPEYGIPHMRPALAAQSGGTVGSGIFSFFRRKS